MIALPSEFRSYVARWGSRVCVWLVIEPLVQLGRGFFFLCTFPPFRFIVRGWRAAFVCERLIFYISNCFSHFGGAGYDLEISRCFFSTDSKKIPVIDPRCVAYEFHGRQAHRPPSISSALTNERWKNTNKKKIRKFQGFIKVRWNWPFGHKRSQERLDCIWE